MSEPVSRVRLLWETVGARVEYMPADLHDRIYAYLSHLPQLVAFAARGCVVDAGKLQGEEARRFTRLMASDPALWADICLANADFVDAALGDFAGFAGQMEGELSEVPAAGGVEAEHAAELFPRVVATCLIATASLLQEMTGVHPARYAGAGFTDMTAPALSDPQAALAAISSHHWGIAKMLNDLLLRLHAVREALLSGDKAALIQRLQA
jgi:prephenate dehydrogenase